MRFKVFGFALSAVLCGVLAAVAAPALAADGSAWWHLTSGARPTYLKAGAGKPGVPGEPEVQEIFAPFIPELEEFGPTAGFVLKIVTGEGEEEVGEFLTEPADAELGGEFTPLNAANVQSKLEAVYGNGAVTVEEKAEAAGIALVVNTRSAGVDPLNVFSLGLGPEPTVNVTNAGKAEVPAVPDGEIYVTAENMGDANVEPSGQAVHFRDVLPKGLKAIGVAGTKPEKEADFQARKPIPCSLTESGGVQTATCTLKEPLVPYDEIEMRIAVNVEPGAESSKQENEVSISGGEASSTSLRRSVVISDAPVPFGVEDMEMDLEEEGGGATSQAGAHPFQMTTTLVFNQLRDINPLLDEGKEFRPEVTTPALPKDVNVKLPPGLIGNPTAIPQCTTAEFFANPEGGKSNRCPENSAVGVATVTVHEPTTVGTSIVTLPIFNLEPREGEPARFGFNVVIANSPVFIDTSVGTGSDYAVTAKVENITQNSAVLSSAVTFWGVPGDPRHDGQRGNGCILKDRGVPTELPCTPSENPAPAPFLSLPTSCDARLQTSMTYDSWQEPTLAHSFPGEFQPEQPLSGCNRLQFAPKVEVTPDEHEASKPTGLTVDVHVPQEVNGDAEGPASANVKDISVTLPEGMTLNPSGADGLQACSESLAGFERFEELETGTQTPIFTATLPEPLLQGEDFCPDASKIGTVKIKSPLLPAGQPVVGGLYLATPAPNAEEGRNPFKTLVAMYIIARDPVSGTIVKLPGKVVLDQATGRITTTFEDQPQLAFEDAEIHLFGGERASLATPATCGVKTTEATFTPWSGTPPVKSSSSFSITSGPNGSPCPGALPFSTSLTGGTTSNNAGAFSPLATTINREDGSQPIQAVTVHTPPGLSGILTGVTLCPEAQANAGTCPQGSLIGHTVVSVGVGGEPFNVTGGEVFLTEGYKGAPFGLSIVNPAVAGPFDLGKVIVRAKVEVDPHTAALTVTTDESGSYAIPHILDGIPLQIKHVNVLIDRPRFTFNPTNCNRQAITGTIASAERTAALVTTPFQATNCASLKFAPKFAVSTAGKTSKASGASLHVRLTYPNAPAGTYANIAKVKVTLPKQLPSRLTTLQKACTAATFDANPGACPKESIVGQARVITPVLPVPLTGPAYFVSHGGEAFPDLTIVLQGYGVTVDLVGSTAIKKGITTSTFKATPDVPFSSFELMLPQGKFSALTANTNLCKSKLMMPTEFQAQNGAEIYQSTRVAVTGCPKALTRKQKLARALKACRKKKKRSRRLACERRARRRFGRKLAGKKHKK